MLYVIDYVNYTQPKAVQGSNLKERKKGGRGKKKRNRNAELLPVPSRYPKGPFKVNRKKNRR